MVTLRHRPPAFRWVHLHPGGGGPFLQGLQTHFTPWFTQRPSKQQRPYSIQHSEHSASSKTLYLVVVHSSCPGYEKPSFNSLVCLSAYHQGTIQNQLGRQRERSRMMSASYTPAAIAIRPPVISSFLGQNMPRNQLCQPSTKLTPFQCIL